MAIEMVSFPTKKWWVSIVLCMFTRGYVFIGSPRNWMLVCSRLISERGLRFSAGQLLWVKTLGLAHFLERMWLWPLVSTKPGSRHFHGPPNFLLWFHKNNEPRNTLGYYSPNCLTSIIDSGIAACSSRDVLLRSTFHLSLVGDRFESSSRARCKPGYPNLTLR